MVDEPRSRHLLIYMNYLGYFMQIKLIWLYDSSENLNKHRDACVSPLMCFFCVLVTCKKASKQAAMLVLFGNLHQYRRLKERHSTDVSF